MATFTSRLGLRKPDPTDKPNRVNDFTTPSDAIDQAVHAEVVTSGTRPTGAAAFDGKRIWESDTKNHLVQYDSTSTLKWYHPSVPGFGPSGPAASSDNLIDHGEGFVWRHRTTGEGGGYATLVPFNELGTRHECKYRQDTAQSFTDNNFFSVKYETAVYTTADILVNTNFDAFTINRAGVWRICAGLRWNAGSNTGTGERILSLRRNANNIASHRDISGTITFTSYCIKTVARLDVADVIDVLALHNTGATRSSDTGIRNNFISMTWLRA
jgi:hypothetical protein